MLDPDEMLARCVLAVAGNALLHVSSATHGLPDEALCGRATALAVQYANCLVQATVPLAAALPGDAAPIAPPAPAPVPKKWQTLQEYCSTQLQFAASRSSLYSLVKLLRPTLVQRGVLLKRGRSWYVEREHFAATLRELVPHAVGPHDYIQQVTGYPGGGNSHDTIGH